MTKFLVGGFLVLGFVFAFGAPQSVLAASVPVVCVSPDHAVWNAENNVIVGCVTAQAWDAAIAASRQRQDALSALNLFMPKGTSVFLKIGREEKCPHWFPAGCVVPKVLVVGY